MRYYSILISILSFLIFASTYCGPIRAYYYDSSKKNSVLVFQDSIQFIIEPTNFHYPTQNFLWIHLTILNRSSQILYNTKIYSLQLYSNQFEYKPIEKNQMEISAPKLYPNQKIETILKFSNTFHKRKYKEFQQTIVNERIEIIGELHFTKNNLTKQMNFPQIALYPDFSRYNKKN